MIDKSKLDKIFSDIEYKIRDIQLEFGKTLSEELSKKMQKEWDDYNTLINNLTDKEKTELLNNKTGFKLSSLEKINVLTLEKLDKGMYKSTITVDRVKDARILEYIYGNRAPMANTLLKYKNKVALMNIFKNIVKKI